VLLGWPLALLPVHILFLELIIDPACTLIFEMEPDEADLMQRKPRRLSDPLFGRSMVLTGLVQGLGVLVLVTAVYAYILARGDGAAEARMLSYVTLVIANLGMIFANRSRTQYILRTLRTPNPAVWWVSGLAIAVIGLVLMVPFLRDLFSFAPLHAWELVLVLAAGLASILISESVKTAPMRRLIERS
jgi:P-type Ca2+ transporter type 2C